MYTTMADMYRGQMLVAAAFFVDLNNIFPQGMVIVMALQATFFCNTWLHVLQNNVASSGAVDRPVGVVPYYGMDFKRHE